MSRYRLSPIAQQDLVDIRDYYLARGSPRAVRKVLVEFAEAFRALGRNPAIGHQREDLAGDRLVLFWPVRAYLIVYRPDRLSIEIVTVVRGSRDIPGLLARLEQ